MKKHKFTLILLTLSFLSLILYHLAPHFSHWIEYYYSQSINAYFIQCLSQLTGLFPFSVLEFGFFALVIYVLLHIIYRLKHIVKNPSSWTKHLTIWTLQTLNLICILWLSFSLGWGLNYSREPLATTLNLEMPPAPQKDLASLYAYLITEANALRPYIEEDEANYMTIKDSFSSVRQRAATGYTNLNQIHPLFKEHYALPKKLLISPLMNYTGITGIYSPFTGEANVNTAILDQSLPVTLLHEMAHQRGFAKEAECNFLAFLSCITHPDADFKYSGYLLAIAYTSQALAKVDYDTLITLNRTISDTVMRDITHNNHFWRQYEGPVEKASTSMNHHYLKANGVDTGVANYGEMVTLLLGYYTTYLKPSLNP